MGDWRLVETDDTDERCDPRGCESPERRTCAQRSPEGVGDRERAEFVGGVMSEFALRRNGRGPVFFGVEFVSAAKAAWMLCARDMDSGDGRPDDVVFGDIGGGLAMPGGVTLGLKNLGRGGGT